MPCDTCSREIIKEQEPNGEFFLKDGKKMCMICRAVKLSPHRKEIESSKSAMEKDLSDMNEKFDKEESDRIIHLAAEASMQAEKTAMQGKTLEKKSSS